MPKLNSFCSLYSTSYPRKLKLSIYNRQRSFILLSLLNQLSPEIKAKLTSTNEQPGILHYVMVLNTQLNPRSKVNTQEVTELNSSNRGYVNLSYCTKEGTEFDGSFLVLRLNSRVTLRSKTEFKGHPSF